MTTYIVFYGDNYYPYGGWNDNKVFYESLELAKGFADGVTKEWGKWAHVVDTSQGTKVYETNYEDNQ